MAKKTFEECKRGDIMYLLDLENNLEVKKVKLDKIFKWYGEETYEVELSNKYNVRGCVKARSRCKNLFTTEEEALTFKDSVEKGEKVFYTVKKGDSVIRPTSHLIVYFPTISFGYFNVNPSASYIIQQRRM